MARPESGGGHEGVDMTAESEVRYEPQYEPLETHMSEQTARAYDQLNKMQSMTMDEWRAQHDAEREAGRVEFESWGAA